MGTPQEIITNSMIISPLTMKKKKNHSSALCRMRWGNGGCEEIKNMKNFNEYNY